MEHHFLWGDVFENKGSDGAYQLGAIDVKGVAFCIPVTFNSFQLAEIVINQFVDVPVEMFVDEVVDQLSRFAEGVCDNSCFYGRAHQRSAHRQER